MSFLNYDWLSCRIGLLSEEFRMRAETDKVYLVGVRVKPYQQKISLDVAFHITCIIPSKHVRIIFRWDFFLRLKHIENGHKLLQLIWIIPESIVILFVLGGGVQLLHNPMERSIASTEDRSRGVELRNAPLWASFMAASVVSLGSLYAASSNRVST